MPNMGAIISAHNTKVLAPSPAPPTSTCNCRQPQNCPLDGRCKTECIVYKATVSAPNKPTLHYHGHTEGAFKTRYTLHKRSFENRLHSAETELSKYLWKLWDSKPRIKGTVKWDIVKRATPYKCGSRRCDLCLTEKMVIAAADPSTSLNKRTEIMSTCRHRRKFTCEQVPRLAPLRPND